ncbi:MAG: asparaginase [Planctomycetes bacterium]|nr:asparaginase [Planctomycetota bacterium]
MKQIVLISTGGTIEKTYDELQGVLENRISNLDVLLNTLQLEGVELSRVPLMNKDSLEMTPEDHTLIAEVAKGHSSGKDGVVVVHGTDRLSHTGERMVELIGTPRIPIVLTGAMRPYQLRNTDAVQNLTEALLAVQLLPPGIYVVMHNRVLSFPGARKDPIRGTFVSGEEWARGGRSGRLPGIVPGA